MSKLNITEEEVTILYSEASREMNYRDQQFKYDKEIPVTQEYKSRINSVLTDMEVSFQPAEFQVNYRMNPICIMSCHVLANHQEGTTITEDDRYRRLMTNDE